MNRSQTTNIRICGCGNCHDVATRALALISELAKEDACATFAAVVCCVASNMAVNFLIHTSESAPDREFHRDRVPEAVSSVINEMNRIVMAHIQAHPESSIIPAMQALQGVYDRAEADAKARHDDL